MSSEYAGTQEKLYEFNPAHVHTWCYSHVLNLVISHSCTALANVSFINHLQSLYVFFSDSYEHMAVWEANVEKVIGKGCMKRLTNLCQTRWRAKTML